MKIMYRSILPLLSVLLLFFPRLPAAAANVVEQELRWPASRVNVVICDARARSEMADLCRPQEGSEQLESMRFDDPEADTIRTTIAEWNMHFDGVLNLREVHTQTGRDAIVFRVSSRPSRCSTSHVGYRAKRPINFISIGAHCNPLVEGARTRTGVVFHEIMHAVGIYHEQERPDRTTYIAFDPGREQAIGWGLYCRTAIANCDKGKRGRPVGGYDFASLMHYSFKGKRSRTATLTELGNRLALETVTSLEQIGQRDRLSPGDISGVRYLYTESR